MFRINGSTNREMMRPRDHTPDHKSRGIAMSLGSFIACVKIVGIVAVMLAIIAHADNWARRAMGFPVGDARLLGAARGNDCESIRTALHEGASSNARDDLGCTPLYYATMNGNSSTVKLLLAAGADPNQPEMNPPLLRACAQHDREMVEVLLQGGANPAARDNMGHTAFSMCDLGSKKDWPIICSLMRARCKI